MKGRGLKKRLKKHFSLIRNKVKESARDPFKQKHPKQVISHKKLKAPYVQKYGTAATFTVWIVDDEYIKKYLNRDFTNFGQHYVYRFIPKNEFWISNSCRHGEESYYIDHMLIENWLMAQGLSYETALDKADIIEKRERMKSLLLKDKSRKHIMKKVHKKLMKEYSINLKVWIIDGNLVRDLYRIDFADGGHDKVYQFIPEKEIWLDDDLSPKERKFVLLHELHERHLMAKGMEYHAAHRSANEMEYFCRYHPKELTKKLKEELLQNKR